MAVQLRGELGQFLQANSFSKPYGDLKSPWGAQLVKAAEPAKVELKDASVQTTAMEGDTLGFKHEGRREAWEETPTDAAFSTEHQPENLGGMPGRQAAPPSSFRGTDRVSFPYATYFVQTKDLQNLPGLSKTGFV